MQAPLLSALRVPAPLLLLLACSQERPDSRQDPSRDDAWVNVVQSRIAVDLRDWRADGASFVASNPGIGLEGRLDRWGAELNVQGERVRVGLSAWGREGALEQPRPEAPQVGACAENVAAQSAGDCLRQVELRSDGLTEWWVSRDDGFQQGWLVDAPVAGEGELRLQLRVEGADADVDEDGARAWLSTPGGELLLVRDVFAWDAAGEPLDAWLELDDDGLVVLVDDTEAEYPVTVDPIYTTASSTLTGPSSSSYFGWSVDGAGDVNADGYDDVIVGAYYYSSGTGAAYVYRGSSTGLSTTASTTLSGSSSSYFGYKVAGIGDVNGDGYDDVAVGAPQYSSSNGRAYVYQGSSTGVSTTAATTISGTPASYTGACVAAAGDVNRDGYADLVVGAPYNGGNSGTVNVYHGSSTGIGSSPTTTINGTTANSYFGWSIASGDANGDGYSDLLIGAYYRSSYTGAALLHVSSGTSVGTSATTSLTGSSSSYFGYAVKLADVNGDGYDDGIVGSYNYSSATGLVSWYKGSSTGLASSATGTLAGSSSSRFGFSLGAADVDADGYDDIIVGSPYYSSYAGRVSLYKGGASGPSSATSTISGTTSSTYLGYAVAGAGDVNGDGLDDIIASAPYTSSNTGAAYVYLGYIDEDEDGYAFGTDCDDSDSSITDSIDFYRDGDSDGYGVESAMVAACTAPGGYVREQEAGFDCDDSSASVNPGATESIDNSVDDDCDGEEICYLDADSDGYRGDGSSTVASEDLDCDDEGEASTDFPSGDCDDDDEDVNPDATEQPGNENDDDCDSVEICYVDEDGDGYRSDDDTVTSADSDCRDAGEARANAPSGDCDDEDANTSPGEGEVPDDGIDQDCSGGDTCYADADADGYRETASAVIESDDLDCVDSGEAGLDTEVGDCDDDNAAIYPDSAEVCDGVDNDCDGLTDSVIPTEGPGAWYEISVCEDTDNDGLLDYTERTSTLTDPADDDSDDDGIKDGTELGLDAPEDPEVTNGTFDADEDPSTTTDPLNSDTDDDGLTDGEEDRNLNGAVDTGETDPNNADSDGGGTSDGDEVGDETDPLDPSDDPAAQGGEGGEGGAGGEGGGSDTGEDKSGGCGCATSPSTGQQGLLLAGLTALLAFRRRRR